MFGLGPTAGGVLGSWALVAGLGAMAGLTATGYVAGVAAACLTGWALRHGLTRYRHTPGPADAVTMVRLVLGCGIAALGGESVVQPPAGRAVIRAGGPPPRPR